MLLCHHPQLHLYLVLPFQCCSIRRMLLPLARFTRQCCYYLAKQSRLSRPGQSYLFVHTYICTLHLYRHQASSLQPYIRVTGPLTCSWVSRHFYPGASQRFPALMQIPYLDPLRALVLSGGICSSPFTAP